MVTLVSPNCEILRLHQELGSVVNRRTSQAEIRTGSPMQLLHRGAATGRVGATAGRAISLDAGGSEPAALRLATVLVSMKARSHTPASGSHTRVPAPGHRSTVFK